MIAKVTARAATVGATTLRGLGPRDWSEGNQRDMLRALDRVRRLLESAAGNARAGTAGTAANLASGGNAALEGDEPPVTAADRSFAPYALERITGTFGLSTFERDLLVLCAGVELSARFADAVAAIRAGAGGEPRPSFGLALAVLPDAHWSALAPDAPLRRWRLVEVGSPGLTDAHLRIDERVLHALAGVRTLDERLAAYVERHEVPGAPATAADAADAADPAVAAISASLRPARADRVRGIAIQVTGGDASRRAAVAAAAAAAAGTYVLRIRTADLPESPGERLVLGALVAREALLSGDLVVLEVEPDASGADERRAAAFLDAYPGDAAALVVTAQEPVSALAGVAPVIALRPLTGRERIEAWRDALGPEAAASLNGTLEALATTFELDAGAVTAAASAAKRSASDLWGAARAAARPRMDGLAQRIEPAAGWDDLVLPPEHVATLRQIALHVRRRHRVHEEWGFAEKSSRGLGIAALFAGPSGTGKTMAAEVLARDLRLDLYRIDLASVVSKYIGETEKNLARVFGAAEGSGAILLFDEADALFGKRSEVRDSHDRYANVEIGYLLQRMETYRGLAILTTNAKDALDPAFLRRLRFVVAFPFPDAALRAEIWRRVFPSRTPTERLAPERLAQLNASGGQIRNIALGAAFIAADAGEPVSMRHLAAAARTEYAKHERQPSDAELRGWA